MDKNADWLVRVSFLTQRIHNELHVLQHKKKLYHNPPPKKNPQFIK